MPVDRPTGQEAVRTALIDAGIRLFAARGTQAVSVREVAREAGVNHGLVHRHFGSKAGLVDAVMRHLADGVAMDMESNESEDVARVLIRTFASSERAAHWRILARAMLDGESIGDLQSGFPVMKRMLKLARAQPKGDVSAEARVTTAVAVGLGLMLFDSYLKESTEQNDEQWRSTRREIGGIAARLFTGG